MEAEKEIVNRVSSSGLFTLDLEEMYQPGERVLLDIRGQLFQEMILREKDFRAFIKEHNWSAYQDKYVAVTCSVDAIIPTWAYMLVASAAEPFAKAIVFGDLEDLETKIFLEQLEKYEWNKLKDMKVVVKGCGKIHVPVAAYVEATRRLKTVASSIMFGEPCSTVPVFKRSK